MAIAVAPKARRVENRGYTSICLEALQVLGARRNIQWLEIVDRGFQRMSMSRGKEARNWEMCVLESFVTKRSNVFLVEGL